ncbi:hypothetical protein CAY59_20845 [Vibrio campbellii]|uniref:hypothetical protein n=1 Tax=Vibrio campbellii TaxID=680 RepID=UPI000A2FFECF|nr:hypothetical protein [Vibrio campbellii]ARR46695.1 hypothetical protein CAY59_20845 [Vibrio campbellii]
MKNELFSNGKKFTRADIAVLLNITDRHVTRLISKGILPTPKANKGMDPLVSIHSYIAYRSQAEKSVEGVDIPQETHGEDVNREKELLKLEELRENIAMKKAKRVLFEKTYAPIEIIVDALQQVGSRINTRIDGLIPKIKMAWPDMPPEAIEVLEAEIAATMNECADVQPDLSKYLDIDEEEYSSWVDEYEKDTAS